MKHKRVLFAIIATLIALTLACVVTACNTQGVPGTGGGTDNPSNPDNPDNPDVPSTFTVTYETNGGTSVPSYTGEAVNSEPQTSKTDNVFLGWYASSDFSGERITFPYTLTKNVTLYAKWEPEAPEYASTALDDFDYTEADGIITLTGYKGSASSIRLPDEATAVDYQGLLNDDGTSPLTSVLIPKNVTQLDGSSFYGVSGLKKIEVEEGHSVFSSLNGDLYSADGKTIIAVAHARVTAFEIPSGTETIGAYAFFAAPFTSVTIPNSVTSIEDYAFYYVPAVEEINVPSSVATVGEFVFCGSKNLKTVIFAEGVETVGAGCFKECPELVTVKLPSSLKSLGSNCFRDCPSIVELTIPATVEKFGYSLWKNNDGLKKFTGPEKATSGLATAAKNLEVLEITAGTSISNSSFKGAANLKTVVLSEGIKTVNTNSFADCVSLTSIKLPDSLEEIWKNAFSGCTSLASIELPNGLKEIETGAFANTAIEEIRIPDSCTAASISGSSIHTVYTPAKLFGKFTQASVRRIIITSGTSVSLSSYSGYENLLSLHIPATVTSITGKAPRNKLVQVTNLSSATFPDTTSYNGHKVDVRTSESASFNGTLSDYDENEICTYSIDGEVYLIDVKDGKTVLTASDLSKCTAIWNYAFYKGYAFTDVTIPGNIKTIEESAFNDIKTLTSLTIQEGVASIESRSFHKLGITEVTIPSSVKTMGYAVFGLNSQITMVYCKHPSKPAGWDDGWNSGYSSQSSPVPHEWIG